MATVTLARSDAFPVGTTVGIYPAGAQRQGSSTPQPPTASVIASAAVDAAGLLTVTNAGILQGVDYVAAAQVGGVWTYVRARSTLDVADRGSASGDGHDDERVAGGDEPGGDVGRVRGGAADFDGGGGDHPAGDADQGAVDAGVGWRDGGRRDGRVHARLARPEARGLGDVLRADRAARGSARRCRTTWCRCRRRARSRCRSARPARRRWMSRRT
jgi:hypothetical protein